MKLLGALLLFLSTYHLLGAFDWTSFFIFVLGLVIFFAGEIFGATHIFLRKGIK